MSGKRVAIIGAGISGLSCARTLVANGDDAVVFDKGRNLGGRVSNRQIDGGSFNHGAQYMRPQDPDFQRWLDALSDGGGAHPWPRKDKPDTAPAFVPDGLPQAMAEGLDVRQSAHVRSAERHLDGWRLSFDDSGSTDVFDELVVTVPAPQVTDVLAPHATARFENALKKVTYDRSMVAMVAFDQPLPAPDDELTPEGAHLGEDGPIAYAVRESAKPGRRHDLDCWVIQANAAWSFAHQDDDKDAIARTLFDAFSRALEIPSDRKPAYLEGHRWRYGLVAEHIGSDHLRAADLNLTLAGDYMLGGQIEHAWLSGRAAARSLQSTTG